MPADPVATLRDRMLSMYDEARALGQHRVAYHALAAVLHACEALRDFQTIELVGRQALDHADWLNRNAPTHPLSAQSAGTRGHSSIFEQLAATAAAARTRLKAENLTRR